MTVWWLFDAIRVFLIHVDYTRQEYAHDVLVVNHAIGLCYKWKWTLEP